MEVAWWVMAALLSVQAPTHQRAARRSEYLTALIPFIVCRSRRKHMEKKINRILSALTLEEKRKLNEMLKALEQKRQLSPIPRE